MIKVYADRGPVYHVEVIYTDAGFREAFPDEV